MISNMNYRVTFWLYLVHMNVNINLLAQMNSNEVPKVIYKLCPYSDICNRTASKTLKKAGVVPCCSPCSCHEDCGLQFDCCFDSLDKYKLEEKGRVACINPSVRYDMTEHTESATDSYFMVQTCENENVDTSEDNGSLNQCSLKDEKGNSLIAPVSSLETNFIYVNKKCAVCNKVDINRMKEWNYVYKSEFVLAESVVTDIENNFKNQLGAFSYVPPMDENWSKKLCNNDYVEVKECSRSSSYQHLCSHLRATYRNYFNKLYKNPFCQLCVKKPGESIDKICNSKPGRGAGSPQTLSMLLNKAVIKAPKLADISRSTGCLSGKGNAVKGTCIMLHCPEGMMLTPKGCTYFALRWFIPLILMQIKLVPQTGIKLPVSELPSHGAEERKRPFIWLKVPCRKAGITALQVYYQTAKQEIPRNARDNVTLTYVAAFIVRIWKKVQMNTGVDPSVSIPLYHMCITKNWLARFENKTYKFDAQFDKYSNYIQDGLQRLTKWPHERSINNREDIPRPASYILLAEDPADLRPLRALKGIVLKKPYFCKQVRVPMHDVEIKFGEILIISKNITLGTNDYILKKPIVNGDINIPSWNVTTFSVCIEDYDRRYAEASGVKDIKISLVVVVVIACFVLVEYLLQ